MEESVAPPRITALVLSYNAASALRRCLSALEASQGRDQMEIIVVDNGSTDESPRLDTEFPNTTFMRLPRYFGATKALNIGMRTAAGEYVFFLAPEIVVEPNTIAALAAYLDADEQIAAVCPLLVDESGNPVPEAHRLPTSDAVGRMWRDPDALPLIPADQDSEAVLVEYPGRRAVMYRKSYIKALNWLDERYGDFGADLELAYQIRRSQKKVMLYPGIRATLAPLGIFIFEPPALATLSADRAHGTAVFAAKHLGWFAGAKIRVGAVVHVLGQLAAFREPGFQMRRLSALIGNAKIDGTQQTL
jgi:GT2 family glycosyltransferase